VTVPAVASRWPTLPPAGATAPATDGSATIGRAEAGATAGLGALARARLAGVGAAAPLGALLLTAMVGQVALGPHLAVRGVAPEVLLVAVAVVAVERGPQAGAGFGFAAGLGADLFLPTPLGTAALACTLVGHVLGRCRRPSASRTAAALCRPESPCSACRRGRRHPADGRVAARRARLRRTLALTAAGVAAGRLGTAVVATALAGVPFPSPAGVGRIGLAAVASAPLGPAVLAALRRLPAGGAGR